jgi:hypothetical protein
MTTGPADPRREAKRDLWALVAVAACCAAIPLALIATGVAAGGLVTARPWLVATGVIIAAAALAVHLNGHRRRR